MRLLFFDCSKTSSSSNIDNLLNSKSSNSRGSTPPTPGNQTNFAQDINLLYAEYCLYNNGAIVVRHCAPLIFGSILCFINLTDSGYDAVKIIAGNT